MGRKLPDGIANGKPEALIVNETSKTGNTACVARSQDRIGTSGLQIEDHSTKGREREFRMQDLNMQCYMYKTSGKGRATE